MGSLRTIPSLLEFYYLGDVKKAFAIAFLLLFSCNVIGVMFGFRWLQWRVRREIKQLIKSGIPERDLIVLRFSGQETERLDWVKKDKEFRFKKTMYDIVRSEISGDSVSYHCIDDQKETRLFSHLKEWVNRHLHDPSSPSPIQQYLKNFHWLPGRLQGNILLSGIPSMTSRPHHRPVFFYSAPFINTLSPPPWSV